MSGAAASVLLLGALIAGTAAAQAAGDTAGVPTVVTAIRIVNGDVIPPWSEEAQQDHGAVARFGYSVANWLHVATQRHVIERELLVSIGDTLDSTALAESERNLRAYPFINEAHVYAVPTRRGEAEVHVRTSDNFTLAPGIIWERGGGAQDLGVIVVENSFLGLGKRVAGEYIHGTYRSTWLGEYRDPQLFGTRWTLATAASHAGTDDAFAIEAKHPFRTFEARTAGGGKMTFFDGLTKRWRNEETIAELPTRWWHGEAWAAHAWGEPSLRAKVTAALAIDDVRFPGIISLPGDWLPRDTLRLPRRAIEPTITLGGDGFRGFHRRESLDDCGVVEDVEAGWDGGVVLGVGLPSEPTRRVYGIVGFGGRWTNVSGDHVTAIDVRTRVRLRDDAGSGRRPWSNLTTDAFLHHYWQGLPSQTLALSVGWRGGWRVDPPYQLILGGDVGLRGYPAYRFEGTRRLLVNLEDRVFTPLRLFTLRLGGVVFADAGYVWPPGQPVRPGDLRADAGFGLRVYNTRASTARVSRLDLAFRLRGERGFLLSLGSEQLFDLLNLRPTPTTKVP